MSHMDTEVTYLKKISLTVAAGTSSENMNLTEKPFAFNFIFGAGSEGITAFEKALFQKKPGDQITIQFKTDQLDDMFGHLAHAILPHLPEVPAYYIRAGVNSVTSPEDREVVQAVAGGTGKKGCDCGCDCA